MGGRREALCSAVAACALLVAAAPAHADTPQLPVGQAHGVRVVPHRGAVAVVFTRRAAGLYRQIAGRKISVECTQFGPPRLAFTGDHRAGEEWRAPKRRQTLATVTVRYDVQDFCEVRLASRSRRVIVSVPLTQKGAIFLDERQKAGDLLSILTIAGLIADDRDSLDWPLAQEVIDFIAGRAEFDVVALESAADTPPPGAVGYFSDGNDHVAVVARSAVGRRLFIEFDADDVSRTNLDRYLNAED
jgi:hypothetical protein